LRKSVQEIVRTGFPPLPGRDPLCPSRLHPFRRIATLSLSMRLRITPRLASALHFGPERLPMKISVRHTNAQYLQLADRETDRHVVNIEKLHEHFAQDLVQLNGDIEKQPRKEHYIFSLNLSVPTGTMHATGEGADVRKSMKAAFAEIEKQAKKHMALLRKDY